MTNILVLPAEHEAAFHDGKVVQWVVEDERLNRKSCRIEGAKAFEIPSRRLSMSQNLQPGEHVNIILPEIYPPVPTGDRVPVGETVHSPTVFGQDYAKVSVEVAEQEWSEIEAGAYPDEEGNPVPVEVRYGQYVWLITAEKVEP